MEFIVDSGRSLIHCYVAIIEEFRGSSVLPYGRDSWSAYRMTDAAIDDGEDIAYMSRRKDYEALRGAELAMVSSDIYNRPSDTSVTL